MRGETTRPLDMERVVSGSTPAPVEAVETGAAGDIYGDEPMIPEFALDGDDDPLNEKTVDLEIPRELKGTADVEFLDFVLCHVIS